MAREVNAATLLAVMIESPEAVENAAGIAAVQGIDVLFIGINDLAEEMGLSGQLDHPRVVEAVTAVAKASASHRKQSGVGGIGDATLLRRYIGMGLRFILGGNDFSFMMSAAHQRAELLRGELSQVLARALRLRRPQRGIVPCLTWASSRYSNNAPGITAP